MKILVAMEYSDTVSSSFRAKGHDVTSCDLLDTDSDDLFAKHYKGDVYDILFSEDWDLIICHPECTKLCVSGNHVYAFGKPKHDKRLESIAWTYQFFKDCCKAAKSVCMENPLGVMATNTDIVKPQYVQPYNFGHNASKMTGLFLYNLPRLVITEFVPGRWVTCKGKKVMRWDNQTDSGQNRLPPSDDRWKIRSTTYKGISNAMADQWGLL